MKIEANSYYRIVGAREFNHILNLKVKQHTLRSGLSAMPMISSPISLGLAHFSNDILKKRYLPLAIDMPGVYHQTEFVKGQYASEPHPRDYIVGPCGAYISVDPSLFNNPEGISPLVPYFHNSEMIATAVSMWGELKKGGVPIDALRIEKIFAPDIKTGCSGWETAWEDTLSDLFNFEEKKDERYRQLAPYIFSKLRILGLDYLLAQDMAKWQQAAGML